MSVVIAAAYRTHGPAVFRRARQILGDEARARRVVRDVFAALVARPAEFSGAASRMTLMYRETTNRCVEQIRSTEAPRRKGGTDESPEARQRAERQASVRDLVRRVPDAEALSLVYYYVDEMSEEEISDLMGRSSRSVIELLELDSGEGARRTARAAGLERTRTAGCLSDLELDRVLVGEVDDELVALGRDHMDECDLCSARWDEIVALGEDLPPLDVRTHRHGAWIFAAVALVAVAAIFVALSKSG